MSDALNEAREAVHRLFCGCANYATNDERAEAIAALIAAARAEGVASGLRQARETIVKLAELGNAMAEGANDGFGSCSICADTPDHEEERDCPTVAWRAAIASLPEAAR